MFLRRLTHARAAKWQWRRRAAVAARQLRLIGPAAVIDAVRKTGVYLVAAEVEIRLSGVAHRPAADAIIEIKQAGF